MYKSTVQLKDNITSAQSMPVYYLLAYYLCLLFTMSSYKLGNEIQDEWFDKGMLPISLKKLVL